MTGINFNRHGVFIWRAWRDNAMQHFLPGQIMHTRYRKRAACQQYYFHLNKI